MAIGSRSQSAKTYLEKNFDSFQTAALGDLVKHGLKALKASSQEVELNEKNVSVGIVSKDAKFKKCTEEEIKTYLAAGDVSLLFSLS
jgi:20S proteasome subunit alpha 6